MKRRGESRYDWTVERDESGLPLRMYAVEITEAQAAEERAEMEAEARARNPVMADLRSWLEARGGRP